MIGKWLNSGGWLLVLPLVFTSMLAAAENSAAAGSPVSSVKMVAAPVQIAAGDLLEISVFDAPELNQQVRVSSDGSTQLALLGNTKVAGLTGEGASDLIARELRERHFLLHPQVNVLIKEFASKGVSVTGEVQHPGVYPVLGARTLLDVLSMAGGLNNVADSRIIVKHRSGNEEDVIVSLKNDDPRNSLANDVQVFPGDLVLVPRAGVVYVLGSVNRPGGFVMQNSGKITLLQALAQAGGTNSTASINKAILLHKTDQGYVTRKLQVGKISRGEEADVELSQNDIVFFPNSRLKSAMHATQGMAESLGGVAIYGVIP